MTVGAAIGAAFAGGELVADDTVVDLCIQTAVIERDAGATVAADVRRLATRWAIGVAVAMLCQDRDQEPGAACRLICGRSGC